MASSANAVFCAVVAAVFWTGLGFAIARPLLPRALAVGAAPVTGWAIHSALVLPILTLMGFSVVSVVILAVFAAIGGGLLFLVDRSEDKGTQSIPAWAFVGAAVLALAPAAAIAPKISADAVQLSSPIFDHSKIALIDSIARLGLPPANPPMTCTKPSILPNLRIAVSTSCRADSPLIRSAGMAAKRASAKSVS